MFFLKTLGGVCTHLDWRWDRQKQKLGERGGEGRRRREAELLGAGGIKGGCTSPWSRKARGDCMGTLAIRVLESKLNRQ